MATSKVDTNYSNNNSGTVQSDSLYTWPDFTQSTSLHGIKYAFRQDSCKIRRFIWLLCVLFMAGFLIYIISILVIDYFEYRTRTTVVISVVDKVDFPQITICSISMFNATKLGYHKNPRLKHILRYMSPIKWLATRPNISAPEYAFAHERLSAEYYANISNDLTALLKFCSIEGRDMPCYEVFELKLTEMGWCASTMKRTRQGNLDLRSTRMTGSQSGLQAYLSAGQAHYVHNLQMSAGFKVLLHDPSVEPDMINSGFLISPGYSTQASIKHVKYRHLPSPYKAFGSTVCLDTKSANFKNTLETGKQYDTTACVAECRVKYSLEKCGCVYFSDPGNHTICSIAEVFSCLNYYKGVFSLRKDDICKCPAPCESEEFEAQMSLALYPSDLTIQDYAEFNQTEHMRTEYAELRIFYENLVQTEVRHVPVHSFDTIFATLGGQMGLFLGASVLTLSEFMEYIIIKMSALIWKKIK